LNVGVIRQSGEMIPRHASESITAAMADTRVVLINGARQSGKSTLVKQLGRQVGAHWFTLDDAASRELARTDPTSFVRLHDRMIIDEIQRDPELLLSIKALVDAEPTPGRFLLTGSARVLGLRKLPDTLVGRMETIELWPLSQGEIDGVWDDFITLAFEQGPDLNHESQVSRDDYIGRLAKGGFPDAFQRPEQRRMNYLRNYVSDLVNRDVIQLSEIERGSQMRSMIKLLAGHSGQLVAPATIANQLEIDAKTAKNYLRLLEEVYLIKRIPAWTRRISARSSSRYKVAFVDSGVAATILDQTPNRLRKPGAPLGGLLEGFVAMELARQLTWSTTYAEMFHYRTRDGVEVDLVLENGLGEVIGIEVKASATPRADDFIGLNHLSERIGNDFKAGFLLYTGEKTLPFGPKLRALPISALWQTAS